MERLVVVGGPGSGKSTVARAAAATLSALHVELDSIWWQEGWNHLEPEDFRDEVTSLLGRLPRWVADGNYVDEIASDLWPLADGLIWIDIRRWTGLRRAVARSARRIVTRQDLWNGNRERLAVLSPRSLLRLWSRWPSYRERIQCELASIGSENLTVVHLRSTKEVRRWLEKLARGQGERERRT